MIQFPLPIPPLNLNEVTIFLAISTIMLLITSELSPSYGPFDVTIEKKKLQNAAVAAGILFLASMVIKIMSILLSSL
jgi:hypothetical protein